MDAAGEAKKWKVSDPSEASMRGALSQAPSQPSPHGFSPPGDPRCSARGLLWLSLPLGTSPVLCLLFQFFVLELLSPSSSPVLGACLSLTKGLNLH